MGWLGVSIQPVTPPVSKVFNLAEPRGALIGTVELNSPAAHAGLEVGDVIVRVDGHDVTEPSDLRLVE